MQTHHSKWQWHFPFSMRTAKQSLYMSFSPSLSFPRAFQDSKYAVQEYWWKNKYNQKTNTAKHSQLNQSISTNPSRGKNAWWLEEDVSQPLLEKKCMMAKVSGTNVQMEMFSWKKYIYIFWRSNSLDNQ